MKTITPEAALYLFDHYYSRIEELLEFATNAIKNEAYKVAVAEIMMANILLYCIKDNRFVNQANYCDMFAEDLHRIEQQVRELSTQIDCIMQEIEPGCI